MNYRQPIHDGNDARNRRTARSMRQGLCGPAARAGRRKVGTEEEEEGEPLQPVFNVVL